MILDPSLNSQHYEQVLQIFSNYLNDINLVINSVKKSIYQILNIQLHSLQALAQPNIASVSANGKKTLDDMKRISSILRGYSRSKNVQREEEQTRRSRIQNSTISRNTQSRISRYSNSSSSAAFSKYDRPENSRSRKEEISMVTFEVPQPQKNQNEQNDEAFLSRLKHYRSLRNLSKTTQFPNAQKLTQQQGSQKSKNSRNGQQNIPLFAKTQNSPMQRKRARTTQKYGSKNISTVITQTETKFKQCLVKHQSGMDEIIRRNGECLQILKDIQKNIKNKKQKKYKQPSQVKEQLSKPVLKYQSMTMSSKRQT